MASKNIIVFIIPFDMVCISGTGHGLFSTAPLRTCQWYGGLVLGTVLRVYEKQTSRGLKPKTKIAYLYGDKY